MKQFTAGLFLVLSLLHEILSQSAKTAQLATIKHINPESTVYIGHIVNITGKKDSKRECKVEVEGEGKAEILHYTTTNNLSKHENRSSFIVYQAGAKPGKSEIKLTCGKVVEAKGVIHVRNPLKAWHDAQNFKKEMVLATDLKDVGAFDVVVKNYQKVHPASNYAKLEKHELSKEFTHAIPQKLSVKFYKKHETDPKKLEEYEPKQKYDGIYLSNLPVGKKLEDHHHVVAITEDGKEAIAFKSSSKLGPQLMDLAFTEKKAIHSGSDSFKFTHCNEHHHEKSLSCYYHNQDKKETHMFILSYDLKTLRNFKNLPFRIITTLQPNKDLMCVVSEAKKEVRIGCLKAASITDANLKQMHTKGKTTLNLKHNETKCELRNLEQFSFKGYTKHIGAEMHCNGLKGYGVFNLSKAHSKEDIVDVDKPLSLHEGFGFSALPKAHQKSSVHFLCTNGYEMAYLLNAKHLVKQNHFFYPEQQLYFPLEDMSVDTKVPIEEVFCTEDAATIIMNIDKSEEQKAVQLKLVKKMSDRENIHENPHQRDIDLQPSQISAFFDIKQHDKLSVDPTGLLFVTWDEDKPAEASEFHFRSKDLLFHVPKDLKKGKYEAKATYKNSAEEKTSQFEFRFRNMEEVEIHAEEKLFKEFKELKGKSDLKFLDYFEVEERIKSIEVVPKEEEKKETPPMKVKFNEPTKKTHLSKVKSNEIRFTLDDWDIDFKAKKMTYKNGTSKPLTFKLTDKHHLMQIEEGGHLGFPSLALFLGTSDLQVEVMYVTKQKEGFVLQNTSINFNSGPVNVSNSKASYIKYAHDKGALVFAEANSEGHFKVLLSEFTYDKTHVTFKKAQVKRVFVPRVEHILVNPTNIVFEGVHNEGALMTMTQHTCELVLNYDVNRTMPEHFTYSLPCEGASHIGYSNLHSLEMEGKTKAKVKYSISDPGKHFSNTSIVYDVEIEIFDKDGKPLDDPGSTAKVIKRQEYNLIEGGNIEEILENENKDVMIYSQTTRIAKGNMKRYHVLNFFSKDRFHYPEHIVEIESGKGGAQSCHVFEHKNAFRVLTKDENGYSLEDYTINPHTFQLEEKATEEELKKSFFKVNGKQKIQVLTKADKEKAKEEEKKEEGGLSFFWIATIVTVVVLVAAGVGFFFYRRSKLMNQSKSEFDGPATA